MPTPLNQLSVDAQALVQACESQAKPVGPNKVSRAVHEDRVGGLEKVRKAVDEIRRAGHPVCVSMGERDRMIEMPWDVTQSRTYGWE